MNQPKEQAPSAADKKTIWFRVKGGKWHAAESISPIESLCGFTVKSRGVETLIAPVGVLPVGVHGDDVCLHCQRALEMARRDA